MDVFFAQYRENLECDALLRLVAGHATFSGGRQAVLDLAPIGDPEALREELDRVADAVRLLSEGRDPGFPAVDDALPALRRLTVADAALDPSAALAVQELARTAAATARSLRPVEGPAGPLTQLVAAIPPLGAVVEAVSARLDPTGEVPDRASPELAGVRRQLRRLNEQIQQEYARVLQRAARRGALQDQYVTVRNSRFVIPVRAEGQGGVPGIVHGSSSSGLTVYVEPLDLVPLNNRFTTLRGQEAEIVERVLAQLSAILRSHLPALTEAADRLAAVDSLFARARFANRLHCTLPRVAPPPDLLRLVEARHPLLEEALASRGGQVVPIDLELTADTPALVISGPNTGGKTVALKTAGLLTFMALSAIPVPAREAACAPFRHLFAAIGDRQSIAHDLSTFSAHVLTLRHILDHYEPPSLVLIDEIGSGTDPEEGSALAMAILEHLGRLGAPLVATTHSGALKEYALTAPGTAVAAVDIHPDTLTPTYRLHRDTLGRSSGLFIARRLGLPETVVQAANRRLSATSRVSEAVLHRLNELQQRREAELADLDRLKNEQLLRRVDLERETELQRDRLVQTLRREFEEARRRFESEKRELFRELKRQGTPAPTLADLERKAQRLLPRLAGQEPVLAEVTGLTPAASPPPPLDPADARPGSEVFIGPMQARGRILEAGPDGALIQAGDKRVRVPLRWLRRPPAPPAGPGRAAPPGAEPPAPPTSDRATEPLPASRSTVPTRDLNLVGRTVDEALPALDQYLDQAFRQEVEALTITHGHGRGILRAAIQERLREIPYVRRFHHPPADQGGEGKTVVELDV